ncbi:hypothetical protein [Variovorax paradoxus]|uniref:hypothetical protein n=1 Tax=Variovorax paradoxus TaxID=34073 RepID=UPI0012D3C446|nr:hypothetical protein [Variovorax paradoxus]
MNLHQLSEWACVPVEPLLRQSDAISAALASSDYRTLDQALRRGCPGEMWDWPAYAEFAQRIGQKATRLRMVARLAHRLIRADHWSHRLPQMLEGADRRPYWQFRIAGDSLDPAECQAHQGRIERFDATFWHEHSPAVCTRVECRCTIRVYAPGDLTADRTAPLPCE